MLLHTLFQQGTHLPPLSLNTLIRFIRIAKILQPSIEIELLKARLPPNQLSQRICLVLARILNQEAAVINQFWAALKDYIWTSCDATQLSEEEILLFNEHALGLNICKTTLQAISFYV